MVAVGVLLVVLALPGVAQNDANPYGFSVWGYQSRIAASGVKWVRLQRDWSTIETSPGVYNFSGLDADVAAATAAGVHATVPIQAAPGSIRGDFATMIGENLVHGSDSPVSAARELGLFFPEG